MSNRKRRGRGEGGIFQRESDGLWVGSISLGYDDKGKRKRKTVYGTTKAEVQEKLRQLQNEAASGPMCDPGRLTVAAYLAGWLANTSQSRVQPKTQERYEQLVRLHINPHLGGVQLSKLTPLHIQGFYAALARAGVSADTQAKAGTMLHTAMRDAVHPLRLIGSNPVEGIARPKVTRAEMHVYNRDQVCQFLKSAQEDRLHALYVLAIDSGMRQGELFGLQWPDMDFEACTVQVRRSLEEINGHHRIKEPKTKRSRRQINLSPSTLVVLQQHRARMLAEGHIAGPVFCDQEGKWLRKSNVQRRSFVPIMKRADLPQIRFHDLRHTSATLLLQAGVNVKVVSERLGHASVVITLDTYSHVLPGMQSAAAAAMEGVFGKQASG